MFSATHSPAPAGLLAPKVTASRFKIAGLAVVSLLPALFWTAIIAQAGQLYGLSFSASSLTLTGSAIALFLAAVCAPLMAST